MDMKNLIGRTLRSGIMVTAAATLLMGNMIAYAAEDDEVPAGIFWDNNFISGTVTEVGSDSITVSVAGAMEEIGFEMGRPGDGQGMGMPGGQGMGMPDGQTPPELPDGQTPPELPDGERPDLSEGELPELPQGIGNMMGQPQGMPQGGMDQAGMNQGMPQGGQPQGGMPGAGQGMGMPSMGGQPGSEVVVNIDSSTVITKGFGTESASFSDIKVGSMVMVSLDGDTALSITVLN